jgi:hypothetical protein
MTKQLLKRFPFQLDSFLDAAVCALNSEGTPFRRDPDGHADAGYGGYNGGPGKRWKFDASEEHPVRRLYGTTFPPSSGRTLAAQICIPNTVVFRDFSNNA